MTVAELRALLKDLPPEAQVRIASEARLLNAREVKAVQLQSKGVWFTVWVLAAGGQDLEAYREATQRLLDATAANQAMRRSN